MNTKIESYIQDKTETLEKVLTFHLLNSIKKYYGTVDNLKKADNKIKSDIKNHTVSNKELSHFNNCFYVSPDKISKIVGKIKNEQGKQVRKTKQVLDNLIKRNNIKILPNYTLRYNSGKTFTVKTRYILDYKYLEKVWNNEEVWKNESSYYTKQEHKLIDKYILNYNKPTKTVKASNNIQEQTKDELEMKTIETEINETETNAEPTMTTKPDTLLLDMLNMMNEKINSLIKDNIELKKELDEIKSSLQNTNISKVEDKKEDITTPVEVKNVEDTDDIDDDINEDNTTKTVPKDLIKDRWGFKYDQIKADKPFNGKQYSEFRDNLAKAHNIKKISYTDYINFLTIIGVKQLPKYDDNQKSTSRVTEYFNAFFDCLVSRGYNMFGMTRMKDDKVQTISNAKTNSQINSNIKTFSKKEYLTAFNKILDEEMNHNYNDNNEDIYNQLLNNGNN